MLEKTDKELITRCQNNKDLKAFEILIKRHQNKVRSVIYKFINNTEDLDDISQEAFIKAFRSINSFKGNSSISTWFCSIAINTCKDKLKSKKSYNQKVINIEDKRLNQISDNAVNTFEKNLSLTEDQKIVFTEIKKLPEEQKQAIILHDIEEYSYEDIAKIANCPVGTVKSRLFNARKKLKEKLKPLLTSITIT